MEPMKPMEVMNEEMDNITNRWGENTANFIGHTGTGNVFILLALYWTINLSIRYKDCRQLHKPFVSDIWFPTNRLFKISDYDCLLIPISIGIYLAFLPWTDHGITPFKNFGAPSTDNLQHIIIATAFLLHWLIVKLMQSKRLWLPEGMEYFSYLTAQLMSLFIFVNHLEGHNAHSPLRVQLHILLSLLVIVICILVALEMAFRRNITLALLRCYAHLLLGTFYWQVSFEAYSTFKTIPKWKQHAHESKMMTVFALSMHCYADLLIIIILSSAAYHFRRKYGISKATDSVEVESLLPRHVI